MNALSAKAEQVRCRGCRHEFSAVAANATVTIGAGSSDVFLPDEDAAVAVSVATVTGPTASLSQVGLEGGVTLEHPATGTTSSEATQAAGEAARSVHEVLAARPGSDKYVVAGEIARGGMGVILRAVDRDVRRDVAMKVLLKDGSPRLRERFVEEAQITGQLEHPNIVPVHELGVDADGRLFITMKLVRGQSLAQILSRLRKAAVQEALQQADEQAEDEYGLVRLLHIYLAVLNAAAFAHDRGVVHRDLKPGNIMVGDFGEVLVMDWGLARVRRGSQWTKRITKPGAVLPAPSTTRLAVSPGETGKAADERLATIVEGFRSHDGDVVGDGLAIEGTPAYMPPEQARGELAEVDERSDIYALGAILYELLTLSPPVRGRSVRGILDDVIAGRIVPPAARAPERTIPRELAAIAMKALARSKAERYQSVLALRKDIELYLADRSVSAKEDSTWEGFVKLVRRNAQASMSIGIATVVVIALTAVYVRTVAIERDRLQDAVKATNNSLDALRREQDERRREQQRSAPAMVAKGKRAAERREFADARQDADLAILYDPVLADARMLRAQLAIRAQDFPGAATDLDAYLALNPDDADARRLSELCTQALASHGSAGSSAIATALADVFVRQGAFAFAEGLLANGKELVALYRDRLEKAWPGCTTAGFAVDKDSRLLLDGLRDRADVIDLSPLEGMPISRLSLARTKVIDLTPLKGMPLTALDLAETPTRNLEPLVGMGITRLDLSGTRVDDLGPLAHMPLEELSADATGVADLAPLTGMPLNTLRLGDTGVVDLASLTGLQLAILDVHGTKVADLAPLAGMPLTELDLGGTAVADLAPLRGLRLSVLRLSGTKVIDLTPLGRMPLGTLAIDRTKVVDLSPLRGMPLRSLAVAHSLVVNLGPLRGMQLTTLDLSGLPTDDISALVGMPLTSLDCTGTQVTGVGPLSGLRLSSLSLAGTRVADLGPLGGMPLSSLDLAGTPVNDLAPLRGAPLMVLVLDGTTVSDLTPLVGMPLKELRLVGLPATDLAPLASLPLERLVLPVATERGVTELRGSTTLQQIGTSWEGAWAGVPTAAAFWRAVDEGEIRWPRRSPGQ
jgi:serine/threonine protein kinase